jgi:hypothetical protein
LNRALLHLVKQFCLGINKATPKDSEVNVIQKDKNTKLGKVTVVHIDESAINPNHVIFTKHYINLILIIL